jgi:restriction endonuclease S subunit
MSWQTIIKENGLDVSIIAYSELSERIDAEYYKSIFLVSNALIENKKSKKLSELADVKGGKRLPKEEVFSDEGISYIRAEDVKNGFVEYENAPKISFELHQKLKSYQTKYDDVLITIVGNSIGDVGIVKFDLKKCNLTENCAKLVNLKEIRADYLFFFLLSKYGQHQIEREKVGTSQPKLALVRIRDFNVPVPSQELQNQFCDMATKAKEAKDVSVKSYKEAEHLLLKEINLEGYKGAEEAISVRNFSEALMENRFDAEYWQPDFDVILDTVSKYRKGVSTIGDEFKQLKGNFKSEKDKEYNYVEIGDVNVFTGEVDSNVIFGAELPANAKIKFGKRQLITSKVRPNRGATAILDNHEGYIGSGAFTVLTEQESMNLETLMVYLKARPIRELLLRHNTGTSYPVITDADVLKLPIPLIDKAVQKRISELVSVSAKERQDAKALLEKAKRAVEIFIEKDEDSALNYLRA